MVILKYFISFIGANMQISYDQKVLGFPYLFCLFIIVCRSSLIMYFLKEKKRKGGSS